MSLLWLWWMIPLYLLCGSVTSLLIMTANGGGVDADDWPFAAFFALFWPMYALFALLAAPVIGIARLLQRWEA